MVETKETKIQYDVKDNVKKIGRKKGGMGDGVVENRKIKERKSSKYTHTHNKTSR